MVGDANRPDPARILIRLPNWLGDVLLARPMLHAVRARWPAARVMGVAPPALLELLGSDTILDEPAAWPGDARGRRACRARVRAWRPDLAFVLPPSFSSAWFAWRGGAGERIGYAHEGRTPLLTHAPRRPARGERHLSDEYLALAEIAGATRVAVPLLRPTAAGAASAHALTGTAAAAGGGDALLGPGALYGPAKRWGAARFAALGALLVRAGHRVLVCGTRAESDVCEQVVRDVGSGAISLAGRTGLDTLTALCAGAALAVCNDSGLAHLAAATGAPTVVVFGSTSSAWTAPLGARVRVVQNAPVCAPCFRRTCRIGYACLESIGVERVMGACRDVAA